MVTQTKQPNIGDVFAIKLEKYKTFYLCQIVREGKDINQKFAILLINYFSDVLPSIEMVKQLEPLRIDHHFHKGNLELFWVETFDTQNLTYIGNTEPIFIENEIEDDGSINNQLQPMLQYLWQLLPQKTRNDFKKNLEKSDTSIWIEEKKDSLFWDGLNELPCLYTIVCKVWNDDLIAYVETNPLITELRIDNTENKIIDISKTNIQKLILDVTGVERIVLNKHFQDLNLNGDFSNLKIIEDPFQGKYISLYLFKNNVFPKVVGIENLRDLTIVSKMVNVLDIVTQFEQLNHLKIWGENGKIENLMELKNLKSLQSLWMLNIFGFDDFLSEIDFPNLKMLKLVNVPKSAGLKAKKEFKSISELDISQLRDEEWIKLNLENPFGTWEGRDGTTLATAKKAMKIYNETYKKLSITNLQNEEIVQILKDFIGVFNQMDKKHSIDTIDREEIWDAYNILCKTTILTFEETGNIFEELRDF